MQISANGITLEVDDQGPPSGEPLLMIMGLGMPLVAWPDALVQMLVSRGFRVIRFDNRDIGLSQHFDACGLPNLAWAGMRYAMHLEVRAPYSLRDMAGDALGVLDALGLASAHVVGASMGGMIAQHVAATRPERVHSLGLLMTTSGSRRLPQPGLRVRRALLSRPAGSDSAAVVAHLQRVLRVIGSPAYPPDPALQQQALQAMVARSWHPAGTARQIVAVIADGDRSPLLGGIAAPTRVIHGLADPLVPAAAGRDLVARIPAAVADFVPGMGHDLPPALFEHFAAGITTNAARWAT